MNAIITFVAAFLGAAVGAIVLRRFFAIAPTAPSTCYPGNRPVNINITGKKLTVAPPTAGIYRKGTVTWKVNGPPDVEVVVQFVDGNGKSIDGPFPPGTGETAGTYEIPAGTSKTTRQEKVSQDGKPSTRAWKYTVTRKDNHFAVDPMIMIGD